MPTGITRPVFRAKSFLRVRRVRPAKLSHLVTRPRYLRYSQIRLVPGVSLCQAPDGLPSSGRETLLLQPSTSKDTGTRKGVLSPPLPEEAAVHHPCAALQLFPDISVDMESCLCLPSRKRQARASTSHTVQRPAFLRWGRGSFPETTWRLRSGRGASASSPGRLQAEDKSLFLGELTGSEQKQVWFWGAAAARHTVRAHLGPTCKYAAAPTLAPAKALLGALHVH